MDGNPDVLFDYFRKWGNSMKKKSHEFWPVQTMLIMLCPDILLQIALANKEFTTSPKGQFIETLQTTFRGKGERADKAAFCLVDLCRASTYVSKSDMSALRYIVPNVESDLKKKLFDSLRPYPDRNVLVQLLVSSFKINPKDLFQVCLDKDAPILFKLILAKTLLFIAKEEPLPWNPLFKVTYSISSSIKKIFSDYLANLRNLQKTQTDLGREKQLPAFIETQNLKKKEKEQIGIAQLQIETINEIINLFCQDPEFILFEFTSNPNTLRIEIIELFEGITSCLDNTLSSEISYSANQALKELFKPIYIEKWCPRDLMNSFYETSSVVFSQIGKLIIDTPEITQEKIQSLLDLLYYLLKKRNEFLISHKKEFENYQTNIQKNIMTKHQDANTKVEIALLILLCNSDPVICSQASLCFDELCEETKLISDLKNENNTIASLYVHYRRLAQVGQLTTGKIAQQKGIRALFRRIDIATNANKAAWNEIYDRWITSTKIIIRHQNNTFEENSENQPKKQIKSRSKTKIGNSSSFEFSDADMNRIKFEWQNYSGFLCSLAAVAKFIPKPNDPKQDTENDPTKPKDSQQKMIIDSFIEKCLKLTVSDVGYIKETIVQPISVMSPSVYPQFFAQITQRISENFSKDGHVESSSEESTLFYDQLISIMKNIMEQPLDLDDLSEVDLENLILSIMNYLSHIIVDAKSLRIKSKMCQLIEVITKKRDSILFRHENEFRNKLIEIIMEWITDIQKDSKKTTNKIIQNRFTITSSITKQIKPFFINKCC
eukprot:Anaeramoba_ignava/c21872_g3_i1.p2 GENE.c21872_g3_i1~~c21872_g3_i1.p2  ORF type:complete len:906 (-),score=291.81 c21872_g3_i1:3138-5465(-)